MPVSVGRAERAQRLGKDVERLVDAVARQLGRDRLRLSHGVLHVPAVDRRLQRRAPLPKADRLIRRTFFPNHRSHAVTTPSSSPSLRSPCGVLQEEERQWVGCWSARRAPQRALLD